MPLPSLAPTPLVPGRLRRATVVLAALLLPLALPAQARRPFTDADIMRLAGVGSVAMAPDGSRILYTVTAWEHPNARGDTALGDRHERRSHVWLVSTDGGSARQLTTGERGESQPQWAPDGATITFVAARGTGTGDDAPRPQIWQLPVDGGEATVLTSARGGVTAYAWSPDGRAIAYVTPDTVSRDEEARIRRRDDAQVYEDDFRLAHLWVLDVATKTARKVTSGDFTVRGAPSWSPDGAWLAFDASPTPMIRDQRRDAYVVSVATGTVERLTRTTDVQSTPAFSPDGRTLAFTILPHEWKPNGDGIMPRTLGNARIVTWDVATKALTDHGQRTFDVDAGALQWSPDGSQLWFTASDRVWRSVFSLDVAARTYTQRTRERLVTGVSLNRDGSRVAFTIDTPEDATEVYVATALDAEPRRLTTTNAWLTEVALGRSEVIRWKSRDGNEVEGVVLYPVGYTAGTRVPLVVSAHGGPTAAHVNGFRGGTGPSQTWASRGWAVLYPNPRGSTGYGAQFMRANINDWGGGDYRDIMAGVDELVRRGVADADRLAFEGWSYGGYLTSWVVSQTGRFKAAMMGAGLPSLLSMAGTTDIPGYIATFFNGYPQYDGSLVNKNIRFYLERSAISYSDRITTPLLILHGANDERVPIGQPMEFYRALKDRGKTVELVFYPREGHGLSEYYHQLDRMQREYAWMAQHTLGQRVLQ
jgi:dipeptidyl aminopeptidase/acylaminoacyl peptidase